MPTHTVSVTTVWPGRRGSSIWSGRDEAAVLHRFVANVGSMFRVPQEGGVWSVTGRVTQHPSYGPQIVVTEALLQQPSGQLLVRFLTTHRAFRGFGIGVARASQLHERFGSELYDILDDGAVSRLEEIIAPDAAVKLVIAWEEVSAETVAVRWLSAYGFDAGLAMKLMLLYGKDLIAKLSENPYRMLAFASWKATDEAAHALGVKADDPKREIAVVEHCLHRRLSAKHTVTPAVDLRSEVGSMLNGLSRASRAIQCAIDDRAVAEVPEGFRAIGVGLMEKAVEDFFRGKLAERHHSQPTLFGDDYADPSIEAALRRFDEHTIFKLTDEQKRAVMMSLKEPFSIIAGGAGVGKTTVLRALCSVLEGFRQTPFVMALSGRAASHMRAATGQVATTIEAFLRTAKSIPVKSSPLVVIDESSMLDLSTMYKIVGPFRRRPACSSSATHISYPRSASV